MRLMSLTLDNFRQFAGHNFIDFGDADNKVTVIYGLNGFGKTGIFRAIIYCLFGTTYLERDHLDNDTKVKGLLLVNSSVLAKEINSTASVTLKFEHLDKIYELTRKIKATWININEYKQEDLGTKLSITDEKGNTIVKEKYEDITHILDGILNMQNKDFFLFDGEQMEELTKYSKESMDTISKGIYSLLNLTSLEIVKKSLRNVARDTEKDIKNNSVSNQLDDINNNISSYENRLKDIDASLSESKTSLAKAEEELEKTETLIKETQEGATKKAELDGIKASIQSVNQDISECAEEMKNNLKSSASYLGEDIVNIALADLNSRLDRGELPANIKANFIKELLKQGKCICGTDLNAHKEACEQLKKYLEKDISIYAEGGVKLLTMLSALGSKIQNKINSNFDSFTQKFYSRTEELENLRKREEDVLADLEKFGTIKDYTNRYKVLKSDIANLNKRIGALENEQNEILPKKRSLESTREEYSKKDSKLTFFVNKKKLVQDTEEQLNIIYKNYCDELRDHLSECATDILHKIADPETVKVIKRIQISEKFTISVLNHFDTNILSQISSGQRQIVSVAYICSLMQVASDLKMPLLMDTPFGRLSGAPREACLQKLPALLSQWILLATDTEFTEKEAEVLKTSGVWKKVYVLENNGEFTKIVEQDINHWKPIRSSING